MVVTDTVKGLVVCMAGMGPPPKANGRKARRNKETISETVVRFEPAEQPELPENINWPEPTKRWWQMWGESPLSENFGATDWDFLLDTALLHATYWSGDLSKSAELRLRVAKFGATPEDRARLRIQFADADEKTGAKPAEDKPKNSRERFGVVTQANFGKQTG